MKVRLCYFASLRDAAGTATEEIEITHVDAARLFEAAAERHGFSLPRSRLRLVVNGEIVDWSRPLQAEDEVVFLPPVSGG